MDEEHKTCQVKMYLNQPCGRPVAPDGTVCICHSEDPDKDVDLFQIEVSKQLAREDYHDFSGFVFPKDFSFRPREFPKDVHFERAQLFGKADFSRARFSERATFNGARFSERATFNGAQFSEQAAFNNAQFSGEANFKGAEFSGEANFEAAQFSGVANFYGAQFSGEGYFDQAQFSGKTYFGGAKFSRKATFNNAQFSGDANFGLAQFSGEASFRWTRFYARAGFFETQFSRAADFSYDLFSGKADFRKTQFSGRANFSRTQFPGEVYFDKAQFSEKAKFFGTRFTGQTYFRKLTISEEARLAFDHTDLHNCHFLWTDIARIEFTVVKWPRRRKLLGHNLLFRRAVADELNPQQHNWEEVGNIYRGLQSNYTDHNRYADAGHFYVAEMDINRKTNREWSYLIPIWFYRKVSLYGQSYLRPFLWLMFVLFLFPAIMLWGGINPSAVSDAASGQLESISYSFSLNPADCFLFQGLGGDYWTVFFKNISFLTFSREKLSAVLMSPFQNALAGLQIPLIVTLIAFFLLALRRQFKRKSF